MSESLAGRVCIVTGASRGIGKGIALQLGEAGATVYITGRTLAPKSEGVGGSLQETAEEVTSRGGKCIPVQCDHGKDEDIEKLFEKVKAEQNGRLDILVNNAYSAVTAISDSAAAKKKFWEEDINMWDTVNNVGLRGHYLASVHAAKLMVPAKQGLIVNISSPGGLFHFLTAPYCIGKSGCDRMASECAIDLKKHHVAFVSLWPGAVKTEHINNMMKEDKIKDGQGGGGLVESARALFESGESPEFSGKAIVHLASDPNVMKKSGKIVRTVPLAREFGFTDINGEHHMDNFSVKYALTMTGHTWMASVTPEFIKTPAWLIAAGSHHFY